MKLKKTIVIVALLAALPLLAQNEPIVVPITDPGKPVTLQISRIHGSIEVEGADVSEIQIILQTPEARQAKPRSDGLRRVPNVSMGLIAEEQNNVVKVALQPNAQAPVLLRVPRRVNLVASTVNGGHIRVRGLSGELELRNTNGAIYADDVSGTVVANTTNGPVRVRLLQVTNDRAMSFSSLNGDIDVTLPASTRANLQMKTNNGEILTDFEMNIQPSSATVKRGDTRTRGGHRVEVDRNVVATINGGGAAYHFTTFNGDIIIRSR